jgi:hypothetical protein
MSTYDKASLVLIPSGTKEGVVFSQKPTNGDGDFTFSRSTAATRVNADGLIEKETQNLLFPSEGTTTGWIATGIGTNTSSILTGQQDPNGGTQGYRWTATCGATTSDRAWYRKNITSGGEVYTFSFWVKSATGSDQNLGFHFSGGTGTPLTATSSWQRVERYGTTGAGTAYFGIEIRGTLTDQSADVYIYGMQLEYGLVARDYIETTTAAVYGGITDNVPRLDYTGGATCPALLLEGQRTNLVTQSEYFGAWNKSTGAITITSNYGLSPDGSQNSSRVQFTAASQHINISTSLGIGVTSTGSVYIKGTAGETIKFETGGVGALRTLNGDWQRIEVTSVSASSLLLINTFGGATARDIEVYGAQCEAGVSYATSYIPTYGTSVTFANDVCNNAGNDQVINSAEGVLYAEISGFENDLSDRYISLSDGGANNSIRIFYYQDGGTTFFRKNVNAVQTTIFSTNTINKSELTKIAIKYNSTNFDIFSNGVKLSTNLDSNSFPINTLNEINFANADGLSQPFYGKTKQVLYFPTALSDAELIALTT